MTFTRQLAKCIDYWEFLTPLSQIYLSKFLKVLHFQRYLQKQNFKDN